MGETTKFWCRGLPVEIPTTSSYRYLEVTLRKRASIHPQKRPSRDFDIHHGACLRNGQSNPQAGFAFVYRPSAYNQTGTLTHGGTIHMRLETMGPTGEKYTQTSNRAELRAVIAALQFLDWSSDCNRSWRSLVFATDSEYVAVNATERIERWEAAGWKLASYKGRAPEPVKNQDLWKLLLTLIRQLQENGVNIAFWRIPREWNERADEFAKKGAEQGEVLKFQKLEYFGPRESKATDFP